MMPHLARCGIIDVGEHTCGADPYASAGGRRRVAEATLFW